MTFSLFSDIPHFKEVVIMATVCDYCGHKTNEVKSGGGIEPKGKRISLKVTDVSDISRDVLTVSPAPKFIFRHRQFLQSLSRIIEPLICVLFSNHMYSFYSP